MSEPTWKTVVNEPLLTGLGFEPATSEDQGSPEYEEIASIQIPSSYLCGRLRAYKDDPGHLYFVFSDEDELDWLKLPLDPTEEALRQVHAHYVEPALRYAKSQEGESVLAQVNHLREASGREELPGDKKTVKWLIGYLAYEEGMVGFENALTMCGFVDPAAIRQATSSGGNYSQFSSGFSASLVTLTRCPAGEGGFFVCEVQYRPSWHEAYTKGLLEEHRRYSPDVPADMPLDVVGLFENVRFKRLTPPGVIRRAIEAGEGGHIMAYAVLFDDHEFEAAFLPLASSESEAVREEIAAEAMFRRNRVVFDAASARGLSAATKAQAKAVWAGPEKK